MNTDQNNLTDESDLRDPRLSLAKIDPAERSFRIVKPMPKPKERDEIVVSEKDQRTEIGVMYMYMERYSKLAVRFAKKLPQEW